jgi:hypothetical protein
MTSRESDKVEVEFARQNNQTLKEFDMNAPVSRLAGIGQCRALDLVPETHVVEFGSLCRQADFDIAQTLAGGQFCKGHYPELLGAGKRFGHNGHHHVDRQVG